MSHYTEDAASALLDVTEAGASVTFTHATPGTYDATTDTSTTPTSSTVTGSAIRVSGDPQRYRDLSLIETENPSLFFTPTTFGSLPALGDSVTWGSDTFVVKSVDPLAPDGTAIAATIIVGR